MSLLDKWGVRQTGILAIPATPATPGTKPAKNGGNSGVLSAPGIANPLRPVAIPGAAGAMHQNAVSEIATGRNGFAIPETVQSRRNAGAFGQKPQESQESQESQGVDSCAGPMPIPLTEGTETTILEIARVARIVAPRAQLVPVGSLPADLKAVFEKRAAIAEVEGGLDRAAAEWLAWNEVNADPVGDTPEAWRAWMNDRIPVWRARGLSRAEARRSVWAEAEFKWHSRHGATPKPDRCAGCGDWILDGPSMPLLDGAVVHFGDPDRFDCLCLYGQEWRGAASAGLMALGLKRPA
jgi:hypothetical protein